MCGVLICINKKTGVNLQQFGEALDMQSHRGPDDRGVFYIDEFDSRGFQEFQPNHNHQFQPILAIGHRRLSILDLTERSRQPMVNALKQFLIYNGEFYNYKDYATKETSHSDALTLFSLLQDESSMGFNKVNGMWASVYGDIIKEKIYLSRDRYGKKPLFYYQDDGIFIASSEIKSIFHLTGKDREVNPRGLGMFLYGRLSPFNPLNHESFYKDISCIPPGGNLELDIKTLKLKTLQDTKFKFQAISHNPLSLQKEIEHDIEKSVSLRLMGDVKIATLVSGGVDSSFISGIIAKQGLAENVEFYTCHIVDQSSKVNSDLFYSRILAKHLNIKLNEIKLPDLNTSTFLGVCEELTKHAEVPVNFQLSSIPTYLISRHMREKGIGIAIDGVGGDEVFGGYPSFQSMTLALANQGKYLGAMENYLRWLKQYSPGSLNAAKLLAQTLQAAFKGHSDKNEPSKLCLDLQNCFVEEARELHDSIEEAYLKMDQRNRFTTNTQRQLFEIERYQLPYYLGIGDSFNMANSVENRSPFLDCNLYKYIEMPEKFKNSIAFNKDILRKSMPSNIPDSIKFRKGKVGIGTPYGQEYLFSPEAKEIVLDSSFVRSIVKKELLNDGIMNDKYLFRSLFSIAMLDSKYPLSL
ncbi:asparagine synthase (glutamine-hydrolyzing) [Gammaproteobacteria bacterium]|nr:asparagine synthase (glutamine-hydrolyzing) [Gammaproteobacteria bacterium]MDA9258882.1 asparagine synthase (glutamine-hydrolyzing) [Gammaproteobacteria bacterium]